MGDALPGFRVGSYIAVHMVILGFLTWLTGASFLLPSLGPSVFVLATSPDEKMHLPRHFIGGQFLAVVSAFVAVEVLLGNLATAPIRPLSMLGLRQVAATFLAIFLTTISMYVTRTQHPPGYATALVISLGIITTIRQLVTFLVAVIITPTVRETVGKRFEIWNLPYKWREE